MRLASLLTILIASASITVLSACSSTNAVPNPPVFAHLYVTDGSGNVDVYRLPGPLTAASTPTLTFAAGGCAYCGLAVSQHKLYVGAGSTVKVYQLPLTASSTSIQTLTASASTTLSIAAS